MSTIPEPSRTPITTLPLKIIRRAREATLPMFRAALGETRGEDPDDVAEELLAVVAGITVDALTDPERFPPDRQPALLRRALARLGLPAGPSAARKAEEGRTPPRVGSGTTAL